MIFNELSVMRHAISNIRSFSTSKPVISKSIHTIELILRGGGIVVVSVVEEWRQAIH